MTKMLLIIGVSGVTCGGKTTIATTLSRILPNSKIVSQDDYFRHVDDPIHTWIPHLNHINFDIVTSLDMEKMYADIQKLTEGKGLMSNDTGRDEFATAKEPQQHMLAKIEETGIEILIIEGFCIFNYKPLLPLFNLKYYFTLDREECKRRRDMRVYDPPDCPQYFEQCVWPEHLKQLKEVQETVQNVQYFSGNHSKNLLDEIIADISKYIREIGRNNSVNN